MEFPVDTVRGILEDQAEDYGHEIRDGTDPYFSIDTGDSTRYDLLYTDEDKGVKAIAEYDTEIGEAMGFWKIEELLEEQR